MNKKKWFAVGVLAVGIMLGGCGLKNKAGQPKTEAKAKIDKVATTPTVTGKTNLGQPTNLANQKEKLCGWVDKSDIIIELSFADGLALDTSYETGFYFSPIMSTMRLARKDCDYRVGFSYEEMKNKGAIQVGVRGYSDNVRRQLEDEPINVVFDAEGKPSIDSPIKVRVLN